MIRAFFALTLNGFREARRNRISVVVFAFAFGLLLSSSLVTEVTVYTFDRVLTDFGLGTMSLTLSLLAIFLSSGQLSKEIERRTIFMIVSKPVSRAVFLVSRFAGNMLTLAVLLTVMAAVFSIQILLYGSELTLSQGVAVAMLWFELLVISAIGFVMSSFSSQMVSAVVTTGAYFAGHLASDIYLQALKSKSELVRAVGRGTYYALPNLERLNFRPEAAYGVSAATGQILSAAAYAVCYSALLLTLAVWLFKRRDFK